MLELQLDAGEELRRLRGILDAHFIPHAAEAGAGRGRPWGLSEGNPALIHRELGQIEANDWQKTLISDQAETIARLRVELNQLKFAHAPDRRTMEEETRGLRKALEATTEDSNIEVTSIN
ncbi:unnamed protein product [Phytomonas sp. Hart1]|nr:unnamed protein product [Phytomonas sp. Hart1]|eukprot:CCW69016.1 unnamed protein product [Phytomonas sp. isolate Hart1]